MDYAIYYALVYQSQLGCSFFFSLSVLSVLSTSIFRFDSFCFQMPGMASSIVFFFFLKFLFCWAIGERCDHAHSNMRLRLDHKTHIHLKIECECEWWPRNLSYFDIDERSGRSDGWESFVRSLWAISSQFIWHITQFNMHSQPCYTIKHWCHKQFRNILIFKHAPFFLTKL